MPRQASTRPTGTPAAPTKRPARNAPPDAGSATVKAKAPTTAKRLLGAALKGLGDVQGDVLARQSRIFEILLGVGQSPGWRGQAARPEDSATAPKDINPFGRFEDVFDQRVSQSIARLGMPSPQQLNELIERLEIVEKLLRSDDRQRRGR